MAEATIVQVSHFEAVLLRVARFMVGQAPAEEGLSLIRDVCPRPACLSAAALALVRETISHGCVRWLVHAGGWRNERFLYEGTGRTGRLWERHPPESLALNFSRHSLEMLLWLTAHRLTDAFRLETVDAATVTPADRLLFLLIYQAVRDERDIAQVIRGLTGVADNALCRLLYAGEFAADGITAPVDFARWLQPDAAPILEAMQPVFESRWIEIEQAKGQQPDWMAMRRQGEAEQATLSTFLDALEQGGRRDLARFMLTAYGRLLRSPDISAQWWLSELQGSGPARLAERLEVQRLALAFLRQAERLQAWERQAREAGFFDDDYAAGKFWLGEWERWDAGTMVPRALAIVRSLEPLRPADE